MTITLQLDTDRMIDESLFDAIKVNCQAAMANRFASIVHNNFGFGGEDRPTPWPSLSSKYAKEFHGGNRVPTLQLTGELQSSIQIDDTKYEAASVWTDNEYASEHQYGSEILPARPFFPMIGDSLTPYSERECVDAAQGELNRILTAN